MSESPRIVVIPLQDAPGAAWPASVLHQVFAPSPAGTPPWRRVSVSDYWTDATHGHLRPTVSVTATVTLAPDHADWHRVCHQGAGPGEAAGARPQAAARAIQALLLACVQRGAAIRGADVVVIVGSRRTDRAFAQRLELEESTYHVLYVDSVASEHTTFCHEVGHAFGFEHPWGLFSEADGQRSAMYGSPVCVMGTAGRRYDVTHPLAPVPGGPPAGAPFWRAAGPRLSEAELYAWAVREGHTSLRDLEERTITFDQGAEVELRDAAAGGRERAAVIRFPDRFEVLVLELRRNTGIPSWDSGLSFTRWTDDDTHDAPGLVVHRIQSITKPLREEGEEDLHLRAWYVGTIPLPVVGDKDLTVGGATPTTISITAYNDQTGYVRAALTPKRDPTVPGVVLQTPVVTPLSSSRSYAGFFEVVQVGAPCADGRYHADWLDTEHRVLLRAVTTGYDEPEFRWSIGGESVGGVAVLGAGSLTVSVTPTLQVQVPTGEGTSRTETHAVTLTATVAWDQLEVTVPPGLGLVDLPVTVLATQAGPAPSPRSATRTLPVSARTLRFGGDYHRAKAACRDWWQQKLWDAWRRNPGLIEGVLTKGDVRKPPHQWAVDDVARALAALEGRPVLEPRTRRRPG